MLCSIRSGSGRVDCAAANSVSLPVARGPRSIRSGRTNVRRSSIAPFSASSTRAAIRSDPARRRRRGGAGTNAARPAARRVAVTGLRQGSRAAAICGARRYGALGRVAHVSLSGRRQSLARAPCVCVRAHVCACVCGRGAPFSADVGALQPVEGVEGGLEREGGHVGPHLCSAWGFSPLLSPALSLTLCLCLSLSLPLPLPVPVCVGARVSLAVRRCPCRCWWVRACCSVSLFVCCRR